MPSAIKTAVGVVGTVVGAITGQTWLIQGGLALAAAGVGEMLGRGARGGARTLTATHHGFQVNVTSTDAPLPVIYGETMVAPRITDMRVDPNSDEGKDLCWVGAIAVASEDGTGIESVENVYFDERLAISSPGFEGEPTTSGVQEPWFVEDGESSGVDSIYVEYGIHAGADDQSVDAELNSRFGSDYTAVTEGVGIAYLMMVMTYDEDVWPNGTPNVRCLVRGQKVYDPRIDTWGWSQNPALCILDYLTSKRYGAGALYSERDGGSVSEIDEASFEAAANYCDEDVSTPAGNQDRFTCNGIIDTSNSHLDNLNKLLSSCRSDLIYQGGKFRLVPRKVDTPVAFELDADSIIGDWAFSRAGIEKTGNVVGIRYPDSDSNYRINEVFWPEADTENDMLSNDNDWEHRQTIELPFTDDLYRAQQIGMTLLRESREDLTVALTAKEEALKLQCGEIVSITHSTPGWSAKPFRVATIGINPDATVRLILREYSDNAYSLDTLNTKDTLGDTSLPDPFTCDPPTGFSVTADDTTALSTQDGQIVPRAECTWTAPANEPFLAGYQLQFKLSAASDYEDAPQPSRDSELAYIWPLTNGVNYDFRIRAYNTLGVVSTWVTDTAVSVTTDVGVPPYPEVSMHVWQSGTTQGSMSVTVNDPALTVDTVMFAKKSDGYQYGNWSSSWDSSTGTPGVDTSLTRGENVTLVGKHNVSIKVRVEWTHGGVSQDPIYVVHTFDNDMIAEIQSIAVDYNASNQVRPSIIGDEDCSDIYANIGVDATPDDPTSGSYDVTISGRNGSPQSTVVAAMGSVVCVKAIGYNAQSEAGPVMTKYFKRGDTSVLPWHMEADPTQPSASTGRLTLTIADPSLCISNVQWDKKTDVDDFSGSWTGTADGTGWDSATGTCGTNTSLTRYEEITLAEKHNVAIKVRVTYKDSDGTTRYKISDPYSFDSDNQAEPYVPEIYFDASDGSILAAIGCDEDGVDGYVTADADAEPDDPTTIAYDVKLTGARNGVVDTGVTCEIGELAWVKVGFTNSDGTMGPIVEAKQLRGVGQISKTLRLPIVGQIANDGSSDTWVHSGGYVYPYTLNNTAGHIPLNLPHGVTITALRIRFYRGSASDSMYWQPYYGADGSQNTLGSGGYSSSTGWHTMSITGLSHERSSSYAYWIYVTADADSAGGDCKISWVEVDYTITDVHQGL